MATAWTIAFWTLWLAPVAGGITWGVHRLAGGDGLADRWPIAAAGVLTLGPAAGGTLLIFAGGVEVGTPLAGPLALLLVALVTAGFLALVWAISHPQAAAFRVGVLGLATLTVLVGLIAGPNVVDTRWAGPLLAVLMGLPLVGVAASAPAAVERWWVTREDRIRWLGPGALAVLLVVLTLAAGGFALVETTTGNTASPAVYTWTTQLEPSGDGTYEVTVPFPAARGDDGQDPVLAAFRGDVHVASGDAQLTGRTAQAVTVRAQGPVTLRASYTFWGSTGHREAFTDWRMGNGTVDRTPGGPANLTVEWIVDFSGGEGHTCWAHGEARAELAPDEQAPLEVPQGTEPDEPLWRAACA